MKMVWHGIHADFFFRFLLYSTVVFIQKSCASYCSMNSKRSAFGLLSLFISFHAESDIFILQYPRTLLCESKQCCFVLPRHPICHSGDSSDCQKAGRGKPATTRSQGSLLMLCFDLQSGCTLVYMKSHT